MQKAEIFKELILLKTKSLRNFSIWKIFITASYYDDWHTGEIMWYNTKQAEYRVLYEDSSEDYITLDDIDGIDIIFID